MKQNYYTAIITHGNLAGCLKRVTEKLIVPSTEVAYYSNKDLSLDEIEKEIQNVRAESKPEKSVFFVDLVGGSCWLLANRIKRNATDMVVIGGVNVPMLISYHMNIDTLNWNQLIEKIVEDGKKGILAR